MKFIIVCSGFFLSFLLGLTYFKNDKEEKEFYRKKQILRDEITNIEKSQRKIYAYACPLRSYFLTGVLLGEFNEEHYPWLLQYNSLTKGQKEKLAGVLSDYFGVTDRTTLEICIEEFVKLDSHLNRTYKISVILFLLTSAADLRYISRYELMNESEKFIIPSMSIMDFLNEFLTGYNKGAVSQLVDRKMLMEHIAHLLNDEFSPMRFR